MFSYLQSLPHSAKSLRPTLRLTTSFYLPPRTLQQLPLFAYQRQITTMSSATSFFDFEPVDKKGAPFPLSSLNGKVVLVVNTASKCGFTPQFEGLEKLYQNLKAQYPEDFTVIGFPCNQFGNQDPGSDDDIQSFCQLNYGVTFPVLGKLDVNGANAAPVWTFLKEQQPGILGMKRIKWNFEKFLVSADGKVVGRWASLTKPEGLQDTIVKEIEKAKKEGTLASLKKSETGAEQAKLS
ncbi:Glutathione peroxidase [Penicillium cf. griseofulvum]|uniref:Glutathione peroxidase n=1 Tax=Penicillium cf. griseofulvum TaxID=2972120 RepID=A0A9W9M2R3_9EURO|nr:Glutathione peroxidase [Penicillium cf. griseofulvum]KAJ5429841.1 Glutathione peroxidase [Penicillium cf. griseofulvum]KAJ5436389.1 Glutathione peroxidase [Penicillium cf. griseofulvum]